MPIAKFIPSSTGRQSPVQPVLTSTITATKLASIIGVDMATAERLLEVASALVENYADNAPDAIKNEAIIRCSGWLYESPSAGQRSESEGDLSTSYSPAMMGALRHSGAMGLLSPFKIRRAGKIG